MTQKSTEVEILHLLGCNGNTVKLAEKRLSYLDSTGCPSMLTVALVWGCDSSCTLTCSYSERGLSPQSRVL